MAAAEKIRVDKKKAFMGGVLHHIALSYLPIAFQPLPLFMKATKKYPDQVTKKHAQHILKAFKLEELSIFPYICLGMQSSLNQAAYHNIKLKQLYGDESFDIMDDEMMMIARSVSIADVAEQFNRTKGHPGWHRPVMRIYLKKRFPGYSGIVDIVLKTAEKISL